MTFFCLYSHFNLTTIFNDKSYEKVNPLIFHFMRFTS